VKEGGDIFIFSINKENLRIKRKKKNFENKKENEEQLYLCILLIGLQPLQSRHSLEAIDRLNHRE